MELDFTALSLSLSPTPAFIHRQNKEETLGQPAEAGIPSNRSLRLGEELMMASVVD